MSGKQAHKDEATAPVYAPGLLPRTVLMASGESLAVPDGWELLPPGDAGLTRRVKAAGEHWIVQQRRGRKIFSRGIWAPSAAIQQIRSELEAERSTDAYARKMQRSKVRRDKEQAEYV